MRDAEILSDSGGDKLEERTRSGQVFWIYDNDSVGSLNARIESFTGFTTKTAELYQIVNYGLGGHYSPHYDSFQKGKVRTKILYNS